VGDIYVYAEMKNPCQREYEVTVKEGFELARRAEKGE